MSAQRTAGGELHAEAVVARQGRRAGGHDVADAGQAGERQRVGAHGHAQARHLGQAARRDSRLAVVADPELLDRAGDDGDDVLERARQLDADDVAVAVETERAPAEHVDARVR